MHKLVGLQFFLSGTPIFSSGTPTFCQMGVLNSCFQNPSESSGTFYAHTLPATEGGIQWREGGEGIIFRTDPVGVGNGRNWPRVVYRG